MSKQILVERKDINLASKLNAQNKIPREYTAFRDSLLEDLRKVNDMNCNRFVPEMYSLLRQAGLDAREARAVVLKDGTELFHWSPITIDHAIKDPEAKNQIKARAGRISAEVKKVRKQALLVQSAVVEATHRGPGRPRSPEPVFKAIVDCPEFLAEFKKIAEDAAKAGTNKANIEISESGKLTLSVSLVGSKIAAT